MLFKTISIVCTCALLAPAAHGADDALRIEAHPQVAHAPAQVEVRAMIARHDDNRTLVFSAESGAFYRSTAISLDGGAAPRLHSVVWPRLPAGTYDLRVELSGSAGVRAASVLTITVVTIDES